MRSCAATDREWSAMTAAASIAHCNFCLNSRLCLEGISIRAVYDVIARLVSAALVACHPGTINGSRPGSVNVVLLGRQYCARAIRVGEPNAIGPCGRTTSGLRIKDD